MIFNIYFVLKNSFAVINKRKNKFRMGIIHLPKTNLFCSRLHIKIISGQM